MENSSLDYHIFVLVVMLVSFIFWLSIPILLWIIVRQRPSGPNLVRCPDCNQPVSRLAANCPHCGRPLAPTDG